MSATVDVLAVMDRAANLLDVDGNPHTSRELGQARAAVAELIEAAKAAQAILNERGIACFPLSGALARVQGGAA